MKMPTVQSEISLIEHFGQTKVIAITLNHEGMSDEELHNTIVEYEEKFQMPVTDVLKFGPEKVIHRLIEYFPSLQTNKQAGVAV